MDPFISEKVVKRKKTLKLILQLDISTVFCEGYQNVSTYV